MYAMKPANDILRIVMISLLLTGCSASLTGLVAEPASTAADRELLWWSAWNDPDLSAALDEAVRSAPELRTAQARLRQARSQAQVAAAGLWPSLSVSATRAQSRNGTGTVSNSYDTGVDARWESALFGGLSDSRDAAVADANAVAASVDATRISVLADVATAYLNLQSARQREALTTRNIDTLTQTAELTGWRLQAGLASSLDAEQATLNLAQAQAALPALQATQVEAASRLAVLLGQSPSRQSRLSWPARTLPAVPAMAEQALPVAQLALRPDVRAAAARWQAARSTLAVQEAARWPDFNLQGSWGWQAASAAALGTGPSLVRTLAAGLSLNVFDAGATTARIDASAAAAEQVRLSYQQSLLAAAEDAETALAAYAAARERRAIRQRASVAAGNAALLARAQHEAGSTDLPRLLEAERTQLAAHDGLAQAELELRLAAIRIYRAAGGAWSAGDVAQPENENHGQR